MSKSIFSNEAFAEWCERQGDKAYDYFGWCPEGCAVQQYLNSNGLNCAGVGGGYWRTGVSKETHKPLPANWNSVVQSSPWDFSTLATRLRALPDAI